MASFKAPAPAFCPGDLLIYKSKNDCVMISSRCEGGINRYTILELDSGSMLLAFRHELSKRMDTESLTEVEFQMDLPTASTSTSRPDPPTKRFKKLTDEEIETLAGKKKEKSTMKQTKFAVRVFQGKYTKSNVPMFIKRSILVPV